MINSLSYRKYLFTIEVGAGAFRDYVHPSEYGITKEQWDTLTEVERTEWLDETLALLTNDIVQTSWK